MPDSSDSSSSDGELVEHLQFKLVLLGDQAVGKTSISRRLVHGAYDATYTPTVGVEFYKTELQLADGIHATLQVWDIGSNIGSLKMAANYLHGCDAVLAVHDITRQETFEQSCQWLSLLQQMFQEAVLPYVAMVANKADTDLLQAAGKQLHAGTASIAHAYSYCVSAKTGVNIKLTFLRVAADLAGVPLTEHQLEAAVLGQQQIRPSSSYPQQKPPFSPPALLHLPTVPPQSGPLSQTSKSSPCPTDKPLSSGLRSRRAALGTALQPAVEDGTSGCCSPSARPQQQVMCSTEQEEQEGETLDLAQQHGLLQTCRCCSCWL